MIAWFAKLPWKKKVGWVVLGITLLGIAPFFPWVSILGIILVLAYAGLRRPLGKYLEWQGVQTLEIRERVGLKLEFIKTAAQILGGAFFLFGLYFTWASLVATKERNRADLRMAQEKQITELYVKAIEQLGRPTLEERLGGIYALERIAHDSEKDRAPIMEVLTAYVRENAPWPPKKLAEAQKKTRPWAKERPGEEPGEKGKSASGKGKMEEPAEFPKLDADIQAVLTVIGRRSALRRELDLSKTDLRRADLHGAHLWRTRLWEANLERADLSDAILDAASLWNARLEGADLSWARGLTQGQIDEAYCDDNTKLPPGLKCSRKKEAQP